MNWRLKILIFNLLVLLLILIGSELVLRSNGYLPGIFSPDFSHFKKDSFYVRKDFISDASGILKVSPETRAVVNNYVKSPVNDSLLFDVWGGKLDLDWTIEDAIMHYWSFHHSRNYLGNFGSFLNPAGEFRDFMDRLEQLPDSQLTAIDSAYLNYVNSPINADGFRSIEFKNYKTSIPKVLIIGDSYAWGIGARPLTNSFADILSARGFVVYNTGIPGTDPAQYLACAEKYIPKLKPDFVIVNFCMANDQMRFKRIAKQEEPNMHVTSLGWFDPFPLGCYLSPQQSYNLNYEMVGIPPHQASAFDRICSKTILTTFLWKLFYDDSGDSNKYCDPIPKAYNPPITEYYISKIKAISNQYESKMLLVLIPYAHDLPLNSTASKQFKEDAQKNFPNITYHMPTTILPEDFDGHFNNQGYLHYANLLEQLLDSLHTSQNLPVNNIHTTTDEPTIL